MIVYTKKRGLIFKPKPGEQVRLQTVIPPAKTLLHRGETLMVVPHRMEETRVLRNLGYPAPSPIHYYYDWSGRFTPFEAQRHTAAFLTLYNRAYVLNDIGTGKSLATLWAWDYLRQHGLAEKLLVVAPLSTLEPTWAHELFQHFPHISCGVLHGSKERRLRILEQPHDVYIINHDGVKVIGEALETREDITHVVVDEVAQCARNGSTDRWKALNSLVNATVKRAAWGLTGTPTPNAPTDAWAQCKLLTPETVPRYYTRFREEVMRQVGTFGWVKREGAEERVHDSMQPAIRYTRDECVDLPPCLYERREIAMTTEQAKAYREMFNRLFTSGDNGESITAANEGVKVSKLLQIICGVAYDSHGAEVVFGAEPRMAEVRNIVESCNEKVIVFAPFVSAVIALRNYLVGAKIETEAIYGDVPKRQRDAIFGRFQRGKSLRVLVAQPAAMSHGLTLTAASTIVWYAPTVSNDTFEQANGRITRPGQRNKQFIIMLGGTPIEQRIYTRLKNKQRTQGTLLDMVREGRTV